MAETKTTVKAEVPEPLTDWNERFRVRDVRDVSHAAMQVSLALVSEHHGEVQCIGTGFAVAPGLAITAGHVVDGWREYQAKKNREKCSESMFSVSAIQLVGEKVFQWRVDAIYGSASSDIAFLRFQRPTWWGNGPGQVIPPNARLNLNPPAVGDELRVFGFPESKVEENGILIVSPSECVCRVLNVAVKSDLPFRYRPFSHIDVEGEILAGMSGGPCFDKDGNVVGVNSKGWDGQQLAHVALLWPAMKIQIDLFKSGEFPAVDLFKEGAVRAIGYRRIYVTPKGEARLAKVDPDTLKPLPPTGLTKSVADSLNFAASNAQDSLAELRAILGKAYEGAEALDTNAVLRCLRHFFWELEAALRLALLLAARQAGLAVQEHPSWETLLITWRKSTADAEILDELATLDFRWNGVDLFEVRTCDELSRSGVLPLLSVVSATAEQVPGAPVQAVVAVILSECRKGGQQVSLPDGLDRFMDATRHFVRSLLRLSHVHGERQADDRKEAEASGGS